MPSAASRPVLILGAGINGCAVARDLVLNRVPVCLVDVEDIASGATSRSSRLIHGGLRYLEYGDVGLVRESLAERARLLRLAPQFVRPLRLFIPIAHRSQGLLRAGLSFLGLGRTRVGRWIDRRSRDRAERGLWPVRIGLTLYDLLAGRDDLPWHGVRPANDAAVPQVNVARYRWLASYFDAQMLYPERFVLAMLEDARQTAAREQVELRVFTYAHARLEGQTARVIGSGTNSLLWECEPAAIINATGAWGDLTLGDLKIEAPRLFGGTKGSHFITFHPQLRQALGGDAVYAEAPDGRLVFVLPFGEGVLVGTTDERFEQRPEQAVATPAELDYLLEMVNSVFALHLTRADIALHYSGVRPLPNASTATTAAISRGHFLAEQSHAGRPVLTLVGGKLTTCREFAEQVADRVFEHLGRRRIADTRRRVLPGGEDYPTSPEALLAEQQRLATRTGLTLEQVRSVWSLCGRRAETIFAELGQFSPENLVDTNIPLAYVRWVIANEWVMKLSDLIERRLMLLYAPELSEACLRQLAACLVATGRLNAGEVNAAVQETMERLDRLYGRRLTMTGTSERENPESGIQKSEWTIPTETVDRLSPG